MKRFMSLLYFYLEYHHPEKQDREVVAVQQLSFVLLAVGYIWQFWSGDYVPIGPSRFHFKPESGLVSQGASAPESGKILFSLNGTLSVPQRKLLKIQPAHLADIQANLREQEVGVDVPAKHVLRVKARPDYEPLFSILDGMRQDADRRFWVEQMEALEDNCDIEEDTGQVSTGVEIVLQMSHNP